MRHSARRHLSALFTLLYLLLAGGEVLAHAWQEPGGYPETHVHAEHDGDHCQPPHHDELHCPTCKLAGLQAPPPPADLHFVAATVAAPRVGPRDGAPPSLRSHAPPSLRAPPLG